jgi:hypothetical protein
MEDWGGVMRTEHRAAICLFALLLCSSFTSAASSEISFTGTTTVSNSDASSAIAINEDGSYLVAGFEDTITIQHLPNLSLAASIDVGRPVQAIEFSPDQSLVAVAISGSEQESDTIQLINMQTNDLNGKQHPANAFPNDLAWTPDGAMVIVPNSNNGADFIRIGDMQIERSLSGEHNTDVTCISVTSNGAYVLTGDASGRMVMWNSDGTPTTKKWELGSELDACDFDPTDTRIASLTVEGQLNTMSFAGGSLNSADFGSGLTLAWSNDGAYLHFMVPNPHPKVVSVDASTFAVIETTYLSHQSLDMDFIENQYGMAERMFIATSTHHVAMYGHHQHPTGYGEAGADLDGDGVPDIQDSDDDGDAILDQWDNYCQSAALDCTRSPDKDLIRNVELSFNTTNVVVHDRIQLNIVLSSSIRNMSRTSLINDMQLSQSESDLFAASVCGNLNHGQFIQGWKQVIVLQQGQLENGMLECRVASGMTLTAQNDYKSHIGFEFIVTFNLSTPPSYPLTVTLDEQPDATDASLAHLAELHPITLTVSGSGATASTWSPWWTVETPLEMTVEPKVEKKQPLAMTVIGLIIDYPLLVLPLFGLIVMIGVGALRAKNSMGMDLDIFDDGEEHSPESVLAVTETEEFEDDNESEDPLEPHNNDATDEVGAQPSAINAIPKKEQASRQTVVKRRKRKMVEDQTTGPITSVKRTRLDGVSSEPTRQKKVSVSKKKKVAKEPPVRKTRRVVTNSEPTFDDSPSER